MQQVASGGQCRGGSVQPAGGRVGGVRAAGPDGAGRGGWQERGGVVNRFLGLDAGTWPGAGQACFLAAGCAGEHGGDVRAVAVHDREDAGHAAGELPDCPGPRGMRRVARGYVRRAGVTAEQGAGRAREVAEGRPAGHGSGVPPRSEQTYSGVARCLCARDPVAGVGRMVAGVGQPAGQQLAEAGQSGSGVLHRQVES